MTWRGHVCYWSSFERERSSRESRSDQSCNLSTTCLDGNKLQYLTRPHAVAYVAASSKGFDLIPFAFLSVCSQMKLQQSVLEMQLTPFTIMLRAVLNQLQEKDQARVFSQPVSIKEVRLTHHLTSAMSIFI